MSNNWKEKYCDKWNPRQCNYFRQYRYCKFGTFCGYRHSLGKKTSLEDEVNKLKMEVLSLKSIMEKLTEKLEQLDIPYKTIEKNNTNQIYWNFENTKWEHIVW